MQAGASMLNVADGYGTSVLDEDHDNAKLLLYTVYWGFALLYK